MSGCGSTDAEKPVEQIEDENCAKMGEMFSQIYDTDKFPSHCCKGLIPWSNIHLFGSPSIEDKCYEKDMGVESVGICLDCGNNICEEIEDPCNCPEDCIGKGKSTYKTVDEFCTKGYRQHCGGNFILEEELCALCE